MSVPLTTSRKFDPTIYGLQKNQQILILILCLPLSFTFIVGCLAFGVGTGFRLSMFALAVDIIIFILIGMNPANLYHFECTLRFLKDIKTGNDFIFKHGKKGIQKAKNLFHIKKIHSDGSIEFTNTKQRPQNFGSIIELKTFSPEDMEVFSENAERMLIGLPDRTLIKTTMKVRSDLNDYSEPIKAELRKNRVPQIVRESMHQHQIICEQADEKSYTNHMLVLIDYTASAEKARHMLDIVLHAISEVLDDMEIGNRRLTSQDEILEMFYGDITFNIHGMRV
jgi:hypothetical protein